MRLFLGLAVSDAVKEALERLTLRLRASGDGLRWSTPDQWHVTLVFLGDVDQAAHARLVDELRPVRADRLTLQIERLGVFERVGILHAEIEVTPELLALHAAVAAAAGRAGLDVENRPYRPHLTLARIRSRDSRKTIDRLRRSSEQQRFNQRWDASEFLLYESKLSPQGSTYIVRERFALQPGPREDTPAA